MLHVVRPSCLLFLKISANQIKALLYQVLFHVINLITAKKSPTKMEESCLCSPPAPKLNSKITIGSISLTSRSCRENF